jgi:hypothetical protein
LVREPGHPHGRFGVVKRRKPRHPSVIFDNLVGTKLHQRLRTASAARVPRVTGAGGRREWYVANDKTRALEEKGNIVYPVCFPSRSGMMLAG